MSKTEANHPRITIPCEDCPLLVGSDFTERKVTFSPDGQVSYQSTEDDCGVSIKKATGERLEQIQDNILACNGPAKYKARRRGFLGKLGLTETRRDCEALQVDPTSSRQLTEYFDKA